MCEYSTSILQLTNIYEDFGFNVNFSQMKFNKKTVKLSRRENFTRVLKVNDSIAQLVQQYSRIRFESESAFLFLKEALFYQL